MRVVIILAMLAFSCANQPFGIVRVHTKGKTVEYPCNSDQHCEDITNREAAQW